MEHEACIIISVLAGFDYIDVDAIQILVKGRGSKPVEKSRKYAMCHIHLVYSPHSIIKR